MTITDAQSKKLRNEAMQLIGSMVVSFVSCEVSASILVDSLTKSKRGTAVFDDKKYNSKQKLDAYKEQLEGMKASEDVKKVLEWIARLDEGRQKRNDIVHSMWTLVPVAVKGEIKFGKMTMPKSGKKNRGSGTIETIRTVEAEIANIQLQGAVLLAQVAQQKT